MTARKELVLVQRSPQKDWEQFANTVLPTNYGEHLGTILNDMQVLADEMGIQPRTSAALGLLAMADAGQLRIVELDGDYILHSAKT